jgi:hypothetical protein
MMRARHPYLPALARERARLGAVHSRAMGGLYWQRMSMGAIGAAASDYAAKLAAVDLHPDNPDQMFSYLMAFLSAPQAFKNQDPCWHGPKDNLSWYESPKGVARLIWPFHGGKWLDNAPKTEAQIRAVFKIPAGVGTKQGLAQLYGFPYVSSLSYAMQEESEACGQGDVFQQLGQGVQAVVNLANMLHIPLVNVTAAIFTGKDLVAAAKADVDSFMQAGAIAKGVVSGDLKPLAAQGVKAAASVGVTLSAQDVANIAQAAETGDPSAVAAAAMGPGYRVAWQMATNYGTTFAANLAPPPGQSYAPGVAPKAAAAAPAPRKVIPLTLGPAHPSGITTKAKAAAPKAAPMSTGAKVAVGAAAVGGASLVAWLAMHGWKWVTPRFARALLR